MTSFNIHSTNGPNICKIMQTTDGRHVIVGIGADQTDADNLAIQAGTYATRAEATANIYTGTVLIDDCSAEQIAAAHAWYDAKAADQAAKWKDLF